MNFIMILQVIVMIWHHKFLKELHVHVIVIVKKIVIILLLRVIWFM